MARPMQCSSQMIINASLEKVWAFNVLEGPGKGSCVERITEIIPLKQFTTTIPSDTWGISSQFENFEAVTCFDALDGNTTQKC